MKKEKDGTGRCYELILNYNCNARCRFCSQGDFDKSLNAPFDAIARNIYGAYKDGYRRLGLTGGEPLIRPDILKVIALGKSVGFRFIRVQTNGIKLADPAFCRALVKAGLTFCKFSFTTDSAAEHDALVGVPGALRKALAGLANLRRLKIRLGTNILVNRRNYTRLPEIIKFYLARGITNFVVIYPVYIGAMAENCKKLGVRLSDCEPYFNEAVDVMEASGLPGEILFLNTPPCFLKGREKLAIGLDLFNTVVTDPAGGRTDLDANAAAAKVKGPPCRRCALAGKCRGADTHYIKRFGWRGFVPVKKGAAARPAGPAKRVYLSDNERCMVEILRRKPGAATRDVLALSRQIVLCRDCSDGNAVLTAAASLTAKGLVKSAFERGSYRWTLARPYTEIKKLL
ncbi:MAG: radical SAM protein [Elusimicrobiales bacterium]|nr:radical SAM protein [Elusimicrobiales bacterium]